MAPSIHENGRVSPMSMDPSKRARVLSRIIHLVLEHHINVAGVSYDAWIKLVDERTPELLAAGTDAFKGGVRHLLSELGTSHTVFYHEGGAENRLLPQHSINASLSRVTLSGRD